MFKRDLKNTFLIVISAAAIIIVFISQLYFINPYTSSWDQVDFALAVKRYDLMAMQPHFPGYPFFILGGKFIHMFVMDPSKSLTIFNIFCYASSVFPIYKLSGRFVQRSFASLSTALIYSATYSVIMVNQPMSEGAALAAFWWYLWSLFFALNRKNSRAILLPLGFLSLMLGIRLSYMPFAIGIIVLFYWKVKRDGLKIKEIIFYLISGIIFQAIWVMGLVISEGSIIGFIKLSLAFTSGHFSDWGGTVDAADIGFVDRLITFSSKNILWTGSATESVLSAVIYISFLIYIFFRAFKKTKKRWPFMSLFYLLFSSYFGWALLAQNVEKARHALPLAALLIFFLCIHLFSGRIPFLVMGLSIFLLGHQLNQNVTLLKAEAKEPPAVYQMNAYIQKMNVPVILYTWEETRVLQYLDVPYTHKRIETYQYFRYDAKYFQGRTVLLTDKVIQGFRSQGISIDGKIKKIATFHSNELFDPVYHEIILYKWTVK
ncbi:glycosyltransferase family 39 protein [Neobacillus drentensis]|uniref:glycosyltransferase family 39 protein n=1 Tax=Neobacillus drentensis TaxID=220684 RepID=UPI000826B134|nr:glycosyltransferase family 39 protein [Neobacillus drentensis]